MRTYIVRSTSIVNKLKEGEIKVESRMRKLIERRWNGRGGNNKKLDWKK